MTMNGTNPLTKEDIYVIGIHILFGIVIGVVFTTYRDDIFPMNFNFKNCMIFVSFCVIVLSWVGYNKRVSMHGHNSSVLFFLDIFIIYLYFHLVFSIEHSLSEYILTLSLIFAFYIVWDVIKGHYDGIKYFEKTDKNREKSITAIVILLILSVTYFSYTYAYANALTFPYDNTSLIEWSILVEILVIIVYFRKMEPPFSKTFTYIKKTFS